MSLILNLITRTSREGALIIKLQTLLKSIVINQSLKSGHRGIAAGVPDCCLQKTGTVKLNRKLNFQCYYHAVSLICNPVAYTALKTRT
eukprot:511009-Pelagomonas_calceolata.AAC.1